MPRPCKRNECSPLCRSVPQGNPFFAPFREQWLPTCGRDVHKWILLFFQLLRSDSRFSLVDMMSTSDPLRPLRATIPFSAMIFLQLSPALHPALVCPCPDHASGMNAVPFADRFPKGTPFFAADNNFLLFTFHFVASFELSIGIAFLAQYQPPSFTQGPLLNARFTALTA